MNTDISIADIVVHLHPETTAECKSSIDEGLRAQDGVVSVHFSEDDHPHALVVAYNPKVTNSETLLAEIRKCDSKAVMAGF
ncbi:MAG: ATP-binding protein [Pseudomonadota bacterium]